MAAQTISIFNSVTNPNVENKSIVFTSGIGFYLIAPTATDEYEIDIFLQVQLTPTMTRMVRLEPLNVSNTERLTVIPQQLRDLGLPMYLAIFPSEAFNLEILLLQPECLSDKVCEDLQTIKDELVTVQAVVNNNGSFFGTIFALLENFQTFFDAFEVAQIQSDVADIKIKVDLILNNLNIPAPVNSALMSFADFNQLSILGVI